VAENPSGIDHALTRSFSPTTLHPQVMGLAPRRLAMSIATALNRQLPERYVAGPQVHLGSIEIDVAAYDEGPSREPADHGGVATAVWAPPRPTRSVVTEPDADEYEVCIYDNQSNQRLVAAIELLNPANKDRPEHRGDFVAKCAAMLRNRVCVTIVEVVTTRSANLYGEVMTLFGQPDSSLAESRLYTAACRWIKTDDYRSMESWAYRLVLGEPLPTLPLWLDDELAVPLELEVSYEETCRSLRQL
jgi:Protein of unknown function (DUF4058)